MDGLFAGRPTFRFCRTYGWKFMIVLKDNQLPSVNSEFEALSKRQPENNSPSAPERRRRYGSTSGGSTISHTEIPLQEITCCLFSNVMKRNPVNRKQRKQQNSDG
jgi:hypothetical protein